MQHGFEGEIIEWRGPAPYWFVLLPQEIAAVIRGMARFVSYGWGVVPVSARIAGVRFTTSLIPRQGGYLLPVKVAVQRQAGVCLGDVIGVELWIGEDAPP